MATENGQARIGKSVVIRGEVKGGEDLIVDGRIEGTVTLSESRLTVGPSANITADLTAEDVLIMGHVQGNIVASAVWNCALAASVEGDVRALRLAIEDNAVFRGKVDLTQGAKSAESVPAARHRRQFLIIACERTSAVRFAQPEGNLQSDSQLV